MLWIGSLESEEEFKIKAKKGYDLASAQVSQGNLVTGIEKVSGISFDTINGSILPPYPVYMDRIVMPVTWSHVDDSFDISVGYKNDRYINRINCKKAMLKAVREWIAKHYKGGELQVLVYSMRSAPMATACYVKMAIPEAKIYLLVTDLPQFMDLGQSRMKAALKKLDWIFIKKMQKQFDGFILYASKMAEFLEIPEDQWILMEGSYDIKKSPNVEIEEKQECKKVIMYSGKLDEQYGICLLIDAFMSIPGNDVELWLTGGGNAVNYIKECAKKDNRIRFYGFIPNRSDVLELQKKATVLINMRLPSEEASKYCFPSKLFEYMATAIPVLTFKLEGIPEEYYRYLVVIDNESVKTIKASIEKVLSMKEAERVAFGEKAKKFVMDNKTIVQQSERIYEWINRREN